MKPKQVPCYETPNGLVKTLAEWKAAQVFEILKGWKDNAAEGMTGDAFNRLVGHIATNSDALVEILSVKEKGRPAGARDRKPRKKASEPSVVQAA